MSSSRRVNKTLDLTPRIGPFPASQFVPWILISGIVLFLGKKVFNLPWIWVLVLIFWGCSTWWVITASLSGLEELRLIVPYYPLKTKTMSN